MKRSPAQKFLQGFVRSIVFVSILILAFLTSYKVTDGYYRKKGLSAKEPKNPIEMDGRLDKKAYNLIYAQNQETGEITGALLEILNTEASKLSFITIPVDGKIALPSDLYKDVLKYNSLAPQIITMERLMDCVEVNKIGSFGVKVLNSLLDIDISYYTIMDEEDFHEVFEMNSEKSYYQLSGQCMESLEFFKEEDIITKVKEYDKLTLCNLSLNERLNYTPALDRVELDEIFYMSIGGSKEDAEQEIDVAKAKNLFSLIDEGEKNENILAKLGMGEKVSLGKRIVIMNGSGISGLATAYKDKLTENGYMVTGIANYDRNDVQTTKILVRDEGLGMDLLGMFHDANVEVSNNIPENIDIQIVIGASESILN